METIGDNKIGYDFVDLPKEVPVFAYWVQVSVKGYDCFALLF